MTKLCRVCKKTKPTYLFHKSKHHADGFMNTCMMCSKASAKERRQIRFDGSIKPTSEDVHQPPVIRGRRRRPRV